MSIAAAIEAMKGYVDSASPEFRAQIERARALRGTVQPSHDRTGPEASRGIDRSGDLMPTPRPQILRAALEA